MVDHGRKDEHMKAAARNNQVIHLKNSPSQKQPVRQVRVQRHFSDTDVILFDKRAVERKNVAINPEPEKFSYIPGPVTKGTAVKLRADQLTFVPYVPKQKIPEQDPPARLNVPELVFERVPEAKGPKGSAPKAAARATLVRDIPKTRVKVPLKKKAGESVSKPKQPVKKKVVKKSPQQALKAQHSLTHRAMQRRKELIRRRIIAVSAVMGVVLAACMVILCGFNYVYPNVFPGVKVGNVDVGGKSVEEAAEIIEEKSKTLYDSAKLSMDIDDKMYDIDVKPLIENIDAEQSAENAFGTGRKGNPFSRVFGMLLKKRVPVETGVREDGIKQSISEISEKALEKPVEPKWEAEGSSLVIHSGKPGTEFADENVEYMLKEKIRYMDFSPYRIKTQKTVTPAIDIDKIAKDALGGAANATVSKEDGRTIIPEKDGIKFDVEEARRIVGDGSRESYTIPGEVTPAAVTAEDLKTKLFRDTLATASTELDEGNEARTENVRRATDSIDGVILNPGDEFSYNDTVGERTEERGYNEAGAYSGNELIAEYGGGVCQPSSTLYMAVLRADLEVTERTNHSVTVSYTPLGEDATVSWGGPDFKFRNNTDYPIKIIAEQVDGQMIATIIGTRTTDKTVEIRTEILETFTPESITIREPAFTGEEEDQGGITGYVTRTYKEITENGETREELANESNYSKRDEIVYVADNE